MNAKTTKELNEKIWFRILKVIYVLFIFSLVYFSIVIAWVTPEEIYNISEYTPRWFIFFLGYLLLCLLVVIIIYLLLKHTFYYIYLGKSFPDDDLKGKKEFKKLKKFALFFIIFGILFTLIGWTLAFNQKKSNNVFTAEELGIELTPEEFNAKYYPDNVVSIGDCTDNSAGAVASNINLLDSDGYVVKYSKCYFPYKTTCTMVKSAKNIQYSYGMSKCKIVR